MIERLAPYAETRVTGLHWLPKIPAHWEVQRTKTILREIDERTTSGEEVLLSLRMKAGLVDHHAAGGKPIPSAALVGFKKISAGEMVMNRMRASTGLFGIARQAGLVSPDYAVFSLRQEAELEYLLQLFKTPAMGAVFRGESKGLGTGQSGFLRLYTDRFGAISIPLPPIEEQRLIVRFLDWHGAMTTRLINAKKRLVGLLDEQRQSIIRRAVTNGFEGFGDLPEGWEVKRLRNVADSRVSGVDKKSADGEQPVRLCNYVDVYKNDTIHGEIAFMAATASAAEIERYRLKMDDVIITKDSEDWRDIGVPALVQTEAEDLVCAYHLALLRPKPGGIEGRFLFWQLLGADARKYFSMEATGVTRYGLSHGSIKALPLIVPPLSVQRSIVAELEGATAGISAVAFDAQNQIKLIQELRARLISDVVTGQLDVNAVAAGLPDLSDELADSAVDDDEFDEVAKEFADEEAEVA